MLIAVCSDKGSPGATTTALALACAAASNSALVEVDPAGGDLALRLHPGGAPLPEAPTVLSVLTAARSHRDQDPLEHHLHVLNPTTGVVPGALLAEQMVKAGDWPVLAQALLGREEPTFVDIGQVAAGSPMLSFASNADLVVVVARPDIASVIRLRERLVRLSSDLAQVSGTPPRLLPVLVTSTRHGSADVADLRRVLDDSPAKPFLVDVGFLAHDPEAVRRLEAGADPAGRLARTNLMRTAKSLIEQVVFGSVALTGTSADSVGVRQ